MATPQPPESTPTGLTPESIAKSGEGLIRLWVAAFTLPFSVANAVVSTLSNAVNRATSALDGQPLAPSNNEFVRATGDLANATGKLYVSIINAATSGLQNVSRRLDDIATEQKPK
ncbi:hypothetical protein [Candidatus Viridilinea mediisalina]|uniref:Uncharacterized protein n=1 Tax=Candidatus Viridilinea mediisalina TaxID=2024553 RepID=A0A2A6RJX1_9CHLR|nr:hypothetical protein [Candidatus Viridilinea mediisalina]PDW03367.1 hypothetical protein CJ255_09280 [Candidatus Viridilinea mediisalina]